MYFPYFMAYIAIGLAITLLMFFWALKNDQFQDQQRVRFLPLRDDLHATPVKATRWHRFEVYGLFFLAVAGLSASAAVLLYALYFSK